MTSLEIEIAVAKYFNTRINLIVPNIAWGMFFEHECDLFIITKSGYGYEIEIKTSPQDIKKDLEKHHKHNNNKIKKLYFAIPESLLKHRDYIPERAGILAISEDDEKPLWEKCKKIKEAKINGKYKFTEREIYNLARLGTMRIWNLKEKLFNILKRK